MVDQNIASWSQLLPWLRRVDTLRASLGALGKMAWPPDRCRDAQTDDDCPCCGAARPSRRPAVGESVHPTSPEHNLSVAYPASIRGTVLGRL